MSLIVTKRSVATLSGFRFPNVIKHDCDICRSTSSIKKPGPSPAPSVKAPPSSGCLDRVAPPLLVRHRLQRLLDLGLAVPRVEVVVGRGEFLQTSGLVQKRLNGGSWEGKGN